MYHKLKRSGYYDNELKEAKAKALTLNRNEVLTVSINKEQQKSGINGIAKVRNLTYVVNENKHAIKKIKEIIADNQQDINRLLDTEVKILIAGNRNPNTVSLLFAKCIF